MARGSDIKIKNVKKYVEDDYETAYRKARKELGGELVLIDKKMVKVGGFIGLFTKKKIEVTFGVEVENVQNKFAKTTTSDNRELLEYLEKMDLLKKIKGNEVQEKTEPVNNSQQTSYTYNPYKPTVPAEPVKAQEEKKDETIEQMKEKIKKEVAEEIKKEMFKEGIVTKSESVKEEFSELTRKLLSNDVELDIIEDIKIYIKENGYSEDTIKEGLKKYFIDNVDVITKSDEQKFIMLVGPTGVGKTTSCAKIGANKYREDKQVAFITADTYRLEAVTQLKAYANIMQVPVEVIRKPDELNSAIEKLKVKDFVIMDTAGRSPRNSTQMEELREYIKVRGGDIEVYLVLSATSKLTVMYDIIERFNYIGFKSIILTKLDEAAGIGGVLSICKKYKLPIAYITTGQGVPDDIEKADKNRLAEIFVEGLR